ncbi:MAG TPA: hypothetical protein P5534_10930, partial [Candidatus Paceibacterota bacterium]|nr:hypothetical protein [Candidatus Paceibacterota bacterium]
ASQIPSSKIGINFCTDPKLPQGSLPHSHCSIRRGEHCFWVARVRRHLPFFQWSNPSLKDHLALFTHGVVGQWTIPKKAGRDYIDQVTWEVREEREDSLWS